MADKEIREVRTHSGGEGSAGLAIAMMAVVAFLLVGGFFLWNYSGVGANVSKGPTVNIEVPATTGQGGGAKR